MSITIFFPESFRWSQANDYVRGRGLPVTMHPAPNSIFAGRTFASFCNEIDFDPKRGCMIYHRPRVDLRRERRFKPSSSALSASSVASV